MTLNAELGVALQGVNATAAGHKILPSTVDDVYLYTRSQPTLAKGTNGRYQLAVTTHRQQTPDKGMAITGGTAVFTITTAPALEAEHFKALNEAFQSAVVANGAPSKQYRFAQLYTRNGLAEVQVGAASGTWRPSAFGNVAGTPGGTVGFVVDLTAAGAQEWAQAIRERRHVAGLVKYQYEYLSYIPQCSATVKLDGKRVFEHLSAALDASVKGFYYGGSAKLDAEWENMTRSGAISIVFTGSGLSPEMEKVRTELTLNFANQAREQWFKTLFAAAPEVEEAKPGDSGGIFGGANFALRWKKQSEVIDLSQTIEFRGWTWLTASADADLATLLADVDGNYLNEVNLESTFPVTITCDSDPMVENTAVSTSFTPADAHWPETRTFGPNGGTATYNVTSSDAEEISITYTTETNFAVSTWPIHSTSTTQKILSGGNQEIIKPAQYVGATDVVLYVQDGEDIVAPGAKDHVNINASYTGPHLSRPIASSGRLDGTGPLTFKYPLDPNGAAGKLTFSAFGVIGGKLVQAKEQEVILDEPAVLVLASRTGVAIQSQNSVAGEEGTPAAKLVEGGLRPVFGTPDGESGPESEETPTGRPAKGSNGIAAEHPAAVGTADRAVDGTIVGVEYTGRGNALIIEREDGSRVRVPLSAGTRADVFDDAPMRVHVELDEDRRAGSIVVKL